MSLRDAAEIARLKALVEALVKRVDSLESVVESKGKRKTNG
jgi:hypothetical protein